jgi:hypothetical protein
LLIKPRLPRSQLKAAFALMVLLTFLGYSLSASQVSAQPTISLSINKIGGYQLGSDISGDVIVSAKVSSDVSRVEFYLNGTLKYNDTRTAPFNWTFKTDNYPLGHYNITAVAYDSSGHQASVPLYGNFVSVLIGPIAAIATIVAIFIIAPLLIAWYYSKKELKNKVVAPNKAST